MGMDNYGYGHEFNRSLPNGNAIVDQERHVELSGSENKNRKDSCNREPGQMNTLHESRIHEKREDGFQKAKKFFWKRENLKL